jgi:hypothetical protein
MAKKLTRIVNMADDDPLDLGDVTLISLIAQRYSDCEFSAGVVEGHPVDTVYLSWDRDDGSIGGTLLLRPDELAALAWCATGVLWSLALDEDSDPSN